MSNLVVVKTAVSGMNKDLAELLDAAETDGVKGVEESQEHDKFVDANKVKCTRVSREMYSVLARYTKSEASTIRDGTRWRSSMRTIAEEHSHEYSGCNVSARTRSPRTT